MFNKLHKSLTFKQFCLLCNCQRIRCLNTRNCSTIKSSKTHPSKNDLNENIKSDDKNKDYLGIFDTNNKDISGLYEKNEDQNNVCDKYKDLMGSRESKMNEQNYLTTTFGRVRLDFDNNPKFHGQYDPNNTRLKFDIKEFEENLKNSRKADQQNEDINQNQSNNQTNSEKNIFEEQYFDKLKVSDSKQNNIPSDNNCSSNSSEMGLIDRQYFNGNPNIEPLFKSKINFRYKPDFNQFVEEKSSEFASFDKFGRKMAQSLNKNEINNNIDDNSLLKEFRFESPLKPELFSKYFDLNIDSKEKTAENFEKQIEEKIAEQMDIKLKTVESTENMFRKTPRTGAQYLSDIQSGKESPKYQKLFTQEVKDFGSTFNLNGEKLDSKGYRILSGQVLDYTKLTHEDILRLLVDSVLFNDNDIVAINKPYGMSIHTKESNMSPVLIEYLPELSESLESEKLYTVHRLDRDTTGVLLLAKSQEKAKQLNRMFADHSIIKRYLCITRGVPDEPEGIIDIPMEIGKVGERERMVLRPEALEEYKTILKPSKTAKRAVTQYKVISHKENAALIEVWPQTGVRHQIRVHLGFGLRCPILGDHKYSHLDKIAPQRLTADILLALNVRQTKVRHIPLHLHAMQYCLPNIGAEGRNIFINAPLPHHIHKNMSKLRLRQ